MIGWAYLPGVLPARILHREGIAAAAERATAEPASVFGGSRHVCGVSSAFQRPSFGTSAAHESLARCLTIRVTSVSRMRTPIFLRSERLQVILPADEIEAIEDFRYKARMPSLAAAVRELLRRGLASDKEDED
jgi:hypothetical protein